MFAVYVNNNKLSIAYVNKIFYNPTHLYNRYGNIHINKGNWIFFSVNQLNGI